MTSSSTGTATLTPVTGTATYTLTPSLTPSSTFATVTPYPLINASLTASNYAPTVGTTETFTLTVTNPSSGVTINVLNGALQIDGGLSLQPNPAAYNNVAPGQVETFTFTRIITSSDTCSLNPSAVASGVINANAPQPIYLTPVYPILPQPITVQRIGVNASVQTAPLVTNIGASLGTQVLVTNTGCISENVAGTLVINGNTTNDLVTANNGSPAPYTISSGSQIVLYSTHLVQAADVYGGLAVPFSYTVNASASNATGQNTNANSNTAFVPLASSLTATAVLVGTSTGGNGTGTILLSKSANESAAHAGDAITFTITMTNNSTGPLTNVTLSDNIVAPLTIVSATSDIGVAVNNAGNVTAAIGTIAAGGAAHLTIIAKVATTVTSPSLVTNAATGTFGGGTPLTASISIPVVSGTGNGGVTGVLPTTGYNAPVAPASSLPIGVLIAITAILTLVGLGAYRIVRHVR